MADSKENMSGTWSVAGDFEKHTSLLNGMKEVAGSSAKIIDMDCARCVVICPFAHGTSMEEGELQWAFNFGHCIWCSHVDHGNCSIASCHSNR